MFSQIIERPRKLRELLGTCLPDTVNGIFYPNFAVGASGENEVMRTKMQEVMFMALQAYKWTGVSQIRGFTEKKFKA